VDLERILEIFGKRGVNFTDYVSKTSSKSTKMPHYVVKVEGVTHYANDEKELAELTKKDEEAQFTEIFEREELESLEKALNKYDLSVREFSKPEIAQNFEIDDKKKGKTKKAASTIKKKEIVLKPLFAIAEEKDEHEFFSLQEVLGFVRKQAHKGVQIQRYKGLGEMNPQQLWDTTMDPARRTILKVALEDAVETEKIFTMLMGDEVEPRREFIESFAHEVTNLDV
jgi:DNA gyrase subunit B